jgi:hypothetical protein
MEQAGDGEIPSVPEKVGQMDCSNPHHGSHMCVYIYIYNLCINISNNIYI